MGNMVLYGDYSHSAMMNIKGKVTSRSQSLCVNDPLIRVPILSFRHANFSKQACRKLDPFYKNLPPLWEILDPPLTSPVVHVLFSQVLAEPLLQLAVTVTLLSLPPSITLTLIVWIYNKLLWLSEPIWLTLEAVGVIYITVSISRKFVQ